MTILYADDDSDDSELVMEALEIIDPSIECKVAMNGKEVIQILKSGEQLPDVILLDVNMPVMDGKACLEELKKTDGLREIPVVIYSTTRDEDEIAGLYELGAEEFLAKANTFEALCHSLNETISKLNLRLKLE